MPKFKIACFIVATILAAVGTLLVLRNLNNDFVPPDKQLTETDLNTYLDVTEDMDISDRNRDVREFLFAAHKKLLSGTGFKGVSQGKSTALGGIEQSVLNTRVVLGEFGNKRTFKEMVTKGVVSNAYQLYLVGLGDQGNYIYRGFDRVRELNAVDWSNVAQPLNRQAFYNKFGHRSDKLTSYILNWDTVLSGEYVEENDGLYTFRYVLDTETAPADLKYEMITNGGLDGFPTFTKCEIYVTMDAEFNVRSLRTDCAYRAKTMGLDAGCTEDITETFAPYDGELPYTDFFSEYLGQTGGDIVEKPTALKMLTDMFSPYLNGEALQARLALNDKTEAFVSLTGLDISDLSNLAVDFRIGELNLRYGHNAGKLLVNCGEFNASTTVEGVTQFAGTVQALLGGETDAPSATALSATDELDLGSLLEGLKYEISDDESVCTVTLPLSLGGVDVNAQLVGVAEGDGYAFRYADITAGETSIHVELQPWTPAQLSENAPEILGLADLISNGKLSLNAQADVTSDKGDYTVRAQLLADLATRSAKADVTLGNNGTLYVTYAEGVVYAQFGNVKFKADTARADRLAEIVKKLAGDAVLPSSDSFQAEQLLGALDKLQVTAERDKVTIALDLGEARLSLILADNDNRWNVEKITVTGYGINAVIEPSDGNDEISVPADPENFADVTELADTFDDAIADVIRSDGFNGDFSFEFVVDGDIYSASGTYQTDETGAVKVSATVKCGKNVVADAEIVYSNGVVYVAVNGVKVAFAVNGAEGETDFGGAMEQLAQNEQIKSLLDGNEKLRKVISAVTQAVQTAQNFDVGELLSKDLSQAVTRFAFENGTLSLSVDGSVAGFDGVTLSAKLYVRDGKLALRVEDIEFADVGVSGEISLGACPTEIAVPSADEYILTLHGEAMGAEITLSLNLVDMDIWADVHFANEKAQLRFVEDNLYVVYGGVKAAFAVTELKDVADRLQKFTGGAATFENLDILAIAAAIGATISENGINLSFDYGDVSAQVAFRNESGKPVFDGVKINFVANGKSYEALLSQQAEKADQLSIDGRFVKGARVVNGLIDLFETYRDSDGFALKLETELTVKGATYFANAEINLTNVKDVTNGTSLRLNVNDGKTILAVVEAVVLDNVLYLDVNGIRQAVTLPEQTPQTGNADVKQIAGALEQFRGVSDVLDGVLDAIAALPADWSEVTFSEIVSEMTQSGDELAFRLDLSQLGLGDVTAALQLGGETKLTVEDLTVGKISADVVTVQLFEALPIALPDKESYFTDLSVELGNGMTGKVHIDLLDHEIFGEICLSDKDKLLFEYTDGTLYVQYGNVYVSAAVKDVQTLLGVIGEFVQLPQMPQTDGDSLIEQVKEFLVAAALRRNETQSGYGVNFGYNGVNVNADFDCADDKVTFNNAVIDFGNQTVGAVTVTLEKDLHLNGVDKTKDFADITSIAQTLGNPLKDVIRAYSGGAELGAEFDGTVDFRGVSYDVNGNVRKDELGNIYLTATLSEKQRTVVELEVTVDKNNNVLYLRVNDYKAAIALDGVKGNADVLGAAKQLLADESVRKVLDEHQELADFVNGVKSLADKIANFDVTRVNFATLLQDLTFNDSELTLTLNACDFDLGVFDVKLSERDNNLVLSLKSLSLCGATLSLNATVLTDVDTVQIPEVKDYLLNVSIAGFGATVELSADLYNMDIWASVHYVNKGIDGLSVDETALLRYKYDEVEKARTLYLQLNNINLFFRGSAAKDIIAEIVALLDVEPAAPDNGTLAQLLSVVTGCKFVNGGVTVSVAENEIQLRPNKKAATQLDTSNQAFANGNALLTVVKNVLTATKAMKEAKGVYTEFTATLSLDGKDYNADIKLFWHDGQKVVFVVRDGEQLVFEGEITVKKDNDGNNILYLDVNGVKQAIKLNDNRQKEDVTFDDVRETLNEYQNIHGVLDGVINFVNFVNALPDRIASLTTVSELIGGLTVADDGSVTLTLAGEKLGLNQDVAVTLNSDGENVWFGVDSIALNKCKVTVDNTAILQKFDEEVAAPSGEFVTDLLLTVSLGGEQPVAANEDVNKLIVELRLDLLNGSIYGKVSYGDNNITFQLVLKDDEKLLYLVLGDASDGSKLMIDLTEDVETIKSVLSQFGVTLPQMDMGGDVKQTVKELLNGLSYDRTDKDNLFTFGLQWQGVKVSATFKVDDEQVVLGSATLTGDSFGVTVKQKKDFDVEKLNLNDHYIRAANVLSEFAPAVNALSNAKNSYSIYLSEAVVRLGNVYYKLEKISVEIVGSDLYVKVGSVKCGDSEESINHSIVENGQIWLISNDLYIDMGGIKLKAPLNSEPPASQQGDASFNLEGLNAALNKLYGHNAQLDELLTLVKTIVNTDFASLDFTRTFGLYEQNATLSLKVNNSVWNLSSDVAVSVKYHEQNAVGLNLGLSLQHQDISFKITDLSVTNEGNITAPPTGDWTTNVDIAVNDDSGIENVVHLRLDLYNKVIYAMVVSTDKVTLPEQETLVYTLYVKYDMAENKLWISNAQNATASVDIDSVKTLVDDVQTIVDAIAQDGNHEIPNLFGESHFDLAEIFRTLQLVYINETDEEGKTKQGIGVTLEPMGFFVDALIDNNELTADVDIRSIFEATTLKLSGCTDTAHDEFDTTADKLFSSEKCVQLDEVLKTWFYKNDKLSDKAEENGVIYDLVNTNAWLFKFNGSGTEINVKGKSYRIEDGSFISFYFNKSDTPFGLNDLIGNFSHNNTEEAYKQLFQLLNTMQLRAKLNIGMKTDGGSNYNKKLYLDIALLRVAEATEKGTETDAEKDTAKSRLYVSYDTSEARSGVLRASVGIDALDDLLEIKDALDSVLDGNINKLIQNVADMINQIQQNKPKLQLGRLARLFDSVTYGSDKNGGTADNPALGIKLIGSALSDKLGNIELNVQPLYGNSAEGTGNGLLVNNLSLSYDDFSFKVEGMEVTASPFEGDSSLGTPAAERTYKYLETQINSYRADNGTKLSGNTQAEATLPYDKTNDHGYDMSKYMDLDTIYELAAALTVTAGNYDYDGQRSFLIKGDIHGDIDLIKIVEANLVINVTMYADIDQDGYSYFAVKLTRPYTQGRLAVFPVELYKDKGGDSYILYNTSTKMFTLIRDSISSEDKMRCEVVKEDGSICGNIVTANWLGQYKCNTHGSSKLVYAAKKDKAESEVSKPLYYYEIAPSEFMAHLMKKADDSPGYLWDLLNFTDTITNGIIDNIGQTQNEYGIEDILDSGDSYAYTAGAESGGTFEVKANLKPISSALGVMTVDIAHNGNFADVTAYRSDKTGKYTLTGVQLNRLSGELSIALNIVKLSFELDHTTPGFGAAQYLNFYDKSENGKNFCLNTKTTDPGTLGWSYYQPPTPPKEWSNIQP